MTRTTRLLLMFTPLALFFALWGMVVHDLRHPAVQSDQCIVTATGSDAEQHGKTGRLLYRQSDNPLNDVRLRCNRFGVLFLNDLQLAFTPVEAGQGAQISHRQYRFLPERWQVSVFTGQK